MRILQITVAILVGLVFVQAATAEELSAEQLSFFETKIRPVLIKECYACHSEQAGNVRGGLRLDTQARMQLGGSSGPAVVPGDPADSLLLTAMMHEDFEMPPKRRLPQSVIDDFRQWIEMGAPDPRVHVPAQIQSSISGADIEAARESFWSYQPPSVVPPAKQSDPDWAGSQVDKYVLAKLDAAGLAPAGDADAHQTLRRLCYDLVGLPPTPEQVSVFDKMWKQDPQQAVEHVVDRLLDNEQYGHRWGRHWLDVARYAESSGREVNMTYPHAWRYRDYVIDAFNSDKPFDRFVQEQIAGDLLPVETDQEWAQNLVATTFLAMGPKNISEQNRIQFAADLVDEQIDAVTRVFLGTSVSCARCHDHKFDAIPQADYYAMAGLFSNMTTYFGNPPSEFGAFSTPQQKRSSSLIRLPVDDPNPYDKSYTSAELEELRAEITDAMEASVQARRDRVADRKGASGGAQAQRNRIVLANQLSKLSGKLAVVDSSGQPRSYCMGVQKGDGTAIDKPLLVRGEIDLPGDTVARGFPQVLCAQPLELASDESGRLELASWIGSDENTLAARVMVNRIWQHLIGQGIVRSTENFGVSGQAPTHPELLDYLAVQFVASGWSVKEIVREIATSRIYRVSTDFDDRSHQVDPDNLLCWRAHPRRLDAEVIRDAMLSVSGELDVERPRGSEVAKAGYLRVRNGVLGDPREMGRQAMRNAATAQFKPGSGRYADRIRGRRSQQSGRESRQAMMAEMARQVTRQLDMEQAKFRSVYLPIVRDELPRSLEVFDFADANSVVGKRESSHTPDQALYMLNNRFVIAQSDAFASRIARDADSLTEQIERAFLLAYGRKPSRQDTRSSQEFIRSFSAMESRSRRVSAATMSAFCQSLFASAEFRLID